MKKYILIFVLSLFTLLSYGQISAVQGTQYETITTVQRDALSYGATDRVVIYNSTNDRFEQWDGSAWVEHGSAGGGGGGANLGYTQSGTDGTVTSDSGTNATLPLATGTYAGLVTPSDFTKLSTVESNATADQTDSEIKTAYENNANTNALTDAEKTLLGNTSGSNTGDQDLSALATKAPIHQSTSSSYTTVTGDVGKEIIMTTGATSVTLDDSGITAPYSAIIFNNTGSALTWAYGSGDSALQGTLASIPDKQYASVELISANTWSVMVGGTASGSGDMVAATYDPTSVSGDAFDMDNMVEGTAKILTTAERAAIVANTSKTSNATHTGDVTGSTALTIATDAVDIGMLSATGTASGSTYLRGDNTWASIAGGGDVSKVGTPLVNEIGWWTGDGTLGRTVGFEFDGTDLSIPNSLNIVDDEWIVFGNSGVGADVRWVNSASVLSFTEAGSSGIQPMNLGTVGLIIGADQTVATEMLDVRGDIAVTGTVDGIDIATDVAANTSKVSNATHTGDVTGNTALTIAADKILESHLKAVNSPTDEYALTYESTTGDFEWQAIGGLSVNNTWTGTNEFQDTFTVDLGLGVTIETTAESATTSGLYLLGAPNNTSGHIMNSSGTLLDNGEVVPNVAATENLYKVNVDGTAETSSFSKASTSVINNEWIECTHATVDITVTLNQGIKDRVVYFEQGGAAQVLFVAGSGVTITKTAIATTPKTRDEGSVVAAVWKSTTLVHLTGALEDN